MIIKASALVKSNSLISTLILVYINHTSKSNKYFSWFLPDKRAGFPSRTPVMSLEYFVCERLISWRLQRLSKPGVQLQAGHISLRWRITKVCYHQLFKKGLLQILHLYRLDAMKIPGSGRGEIGRPPRWGKILLFLFLTLMSIRRPSLNHKIGNSEAEFFKSHWRIFLSLIANSLIARDVFIVLVFWIPWI